MVPADAGLASGFTVSLILSPSLSSPRVSLLQQLQDYSDSDNHYGAEQNHDDQCDEIMHQATQVLRWPGSCFSKHTIPSEVS